MTNTNEYYDNYLKLNNQSTLIYLQFLDVNIDFIEYIITVHKELCENSIGYNTPDNTRLLAYLVGIKSFEANLSSIENQLKNIISEFKENNIEEFILDNQYPMDALNKVIVLSNILKHTTGKLIRSTQAERRQEVSDKIQDILSNGDTINGIKYNPFNSNKIILDVIKEVFEKIISVDPLVDELKDIIIDNSNICFNSANKTIQM